ncbi:MAG: Ni/Fe-hydrogenase cytochrome b subunit [Desulfarculus sp.]|nr:Ni/Fe-hydrogenase cytochrome b subunit [Pseudomonadota bacterium]MBU4573627.1 Ni/Fe-hydrogenase cytochrome b subunit [Pseudomonadota bacterium]MBU4597758.1 Ni/Fe-hydrogenase cytochrome b subunit [Pseudomonadota bacterium]MBV1718198.1 Ni/Fe-hydrogenase cytochrome b subunit [Desulfarculus sp.]MBV1737970.1 Ni/Fe-hydrogenase cytochrome b subunit [Desulfarculus sp.]
MTRTARALPRQERPSVSAGALWLWGALALMGLALILWRFVGGLGAISNLNDGRPWGLWISLDVYSGVALASGGFALTAAVYVFGLKKYYPVVRSAVLSAFLGYLMVVAGVAIDTDQPWRLWHIMVFWNPQSPLFEVGWCVMLYTAVLALEFSPEIFERFNLQAPLGLIRAIEIPLSILGIALATMHQSSLGTALLLVPYKMHPLWFTPVLPVLFFLSAIPVGLAAVIAENALAGKPGNRRTDLPVLSGLASALPYLLGLYLALRFGALAWEGKLGLLGNTGKYDLLFWAEISLGFALPLVLFSLRRVRGSRPALFAGSLLVIAGVVLNRLDSSLVSLTTRSGFDYFPSVEEFLVSLGIIAMGVLAYMAIDRLIHQPYSSY